MAKRDELKQWRDKGIVRDVARHYIDHGIKYEDALDWIHSKIGDEDAALYAALGATKEQALYWEENNQNAYWYRMWTRDEELTHEEAIRWIEAGFDMNEAAGWVRYDYYHGPIEPDPFSVACAWKERAGTQDVIWFANGFEIDDAKKLVDAGLYFYDASELIKVGMTADEVVEWNNAGIRGSHARMFFQYKATIEQAKAWLEAGHSWVDYDCHDRETGDLIPRKYDELVSREAADIIRNLPGWMEHIDHCIENESFEMLEEAYNEAKNHWATAAIKIAQVFERVEARRAERIARDVAALKEAAG